MPSADVNLDSPSTPPASVNTGALATDLCRWGFLAARNPLLLFLLSGLLLLRLAERQLSLLLFHDPPRNSPRSAHARDEANATSPNILHRSLHVSA